jgi:hypothetical protein
MRNAAQQGGCRVILGITTDGDLDAELPVDSSFRHAPHRVVGALGVHVGPQHSQCHLEISLIERCDRVDAAQRPDDLGSLNQGHQRPTWALDGPHRAV